MLCDRFNLPILSLSSSLSTVYILINIALKIYNFVMFNSISAAPFYI